jgi:hypothetical protein
MPGAIVRASWLPANIGLAIREIESMTRGSALSAPRHVSLIGRAAVGAGHMRIDGDATTQAAIVEGLRASPMFGNVVVVRGSDELKQRVDVWGTQGGRQPLFDALKRTFDPNGVLNAGRGPL